VTHQADPRPTVTRPAGGSPPAGEDRHAGECWALVLAGGDGTRLQELTRAITGAPIPKQYCRILGDRSLLEATLARVARFAPPERTLVVVSRPHRRLAQDQLGNLPPSNLLVQRCNRDTGPGVLFGLLEIVRRAPEARVAVFPSDHYVGDEPAFLAHVTRAARLVELCPEKIALLGFRPDRAEPGYGYIQPADPLGLPGCASAFHVEAFHEKPTAEHARLIVRGGGLWNSLVMVFEVARMLALVQTVRSAEFEDMRTLAHDPAAADRTYPRLARWNFSSDFLTRVPRHLAVLPVDDVPWSDWGTPEAVERTLLRLEHALPWRTFRSAPAHGC
jgi:mannose-1-phosphate guanylyltransferase